MVVAVALHALHRTKESDAALERATTQLGDAWPYAIATISAYRGRSDAAMRWLETAYRSHGVDAWLIKGDPAFRGMARDPRYVAFIHKMKLST